MIILNFYANILIQKYYILNKLIILVNHEK